MTETSNKPSFIAYTVRDGKDKDGKGHWDRVGAAWLTKSGEGLRVLLTANPVNGEMYLLPPKDETAAEAA